jgi:hypothetical protein
VSLTYGSGLYKYSGAMSEARPIYDQIHPSGYEFKQKYKLLYCGEMQAWTILRMTESQDPQQACQTQWLIASKETEGFSVFEPDSWMEFHRSTALTSSDLILKCNQCEKENELVHCNRDGTCNEDTGRCECNVAFGPLCEYMPPCITLKTTGNSALTATYEGEYKVVLGESSNMRVMAG